MTLREMKRVLIMINAYDPRRVITEVVVLSWLRIFEPVPFDVACAAVEEFYRGEDSELLMPGKLLAICKEIRDRRRRAKEREAQASRYAIEPARHVDDRLMVPVESPFLQWEHEQRKPAWQDDAPPSPIITDAARLIALEEEKQRQLAALKILMEGEHSDVGDPGGSPEGVL